MERSASGARRCRSESPDLGDQLLMDAIHLFNVDMDNFVAIGKVDAGVMPTEATATDYVPTAHNATGLVDVDVPLDITRHIASKA